MTRYAGGASYCACVERSGVCGATAVGDWGRRGVRGTGISERGAATPRRRPFSCGLPPARNAADASRFFYRALLVRIRRRGGPGRSEEIPPPTPAKGDAGGGSGTRSGKERLDRSPVELYFVGSSLVCMTTYMQPNTDSAGGAASRKRRHTSPRKKTTRSRCGRCGNTRLRCTQSRPS